MEIYLDPAFAERIALVPGGGYHVVASWVPGFPSTYGLRIEEAGELAFLGVSDWKPGETVRAELFAPITVGEPRVLVGHDAPENDCYEKITNTEIEFLMHDTSVRLHQGQSDMLGECCVDLDIARNVQYTDKCVDAGMNEISFTVSRFEQLTSAVPRGRPKTAPSNR